MDDTIFLTVFDKGITRAQRGDDGQWQVTTLAESHQVTSLAGAPNRPRTIFAGTRDGVLRSDDAGLTWQPSGLTGQIVKSIAVSPADPDVVYAGLKPAGVAFSRDGGHTWTVSAGFKRQWWWFSPAEPPDYRPYVMCVAPSPTERDVVLAGVELGAVMRSADGGQTWSKHRKGSLRDCHSLKFHAADGDWVYQAGGTGGGASFSRDGGRLFRKEKRGLVKNYGVVCGADAVKPEIWYVCVAPSPFKAFTNEAQAYLYRASGGGGWEAIGWQAHPLPVAPTALIGVPGSAGELYAGLYNGDVWHTIDYGDTWQKLPFNLGGVWYSLVVLDAAAAAPSGAVAAVASA